MAGPSSLRVILSNSLRLLAPCLLSQWDWSLHPFPLKEKCSTTCKYVLWIDGNGLIAMEHSNLKRESIIEHLSSPSLYMVNIWALYRHSVLNLQDNSVSHSLLCPFLQMGKLTLAECHGANGNPHLGIPELCPLFPGYYHLLSLASHGVFTLQLQSLIWRLLNASLMFHLKGSLAIYLKNA